jgi:hypothetical protein
MDCKLSDGSKKEAAPARLARIRESIRGGNWDAASSFARSLADCPVPPLPHELGGYLSALKETVILAKASRSVSAASLARVRAAAGFSNQANRQKLADLTDSGHSD